MLFQLNSLFIFSFETVIIPTCPLSQGQLKDEVLDDLVYIIHDRLYKIADEQKDINISLQNMDKSLEKIKDILGSPKK